MGLFQTEAVFMIYVIQTLLIVFAYVFRFYSEWFLLLSYGFFALSVVGIFTLADRTGWKFKRFSFIDQVVKGKLKKLRGKQYGIRIVFRPLEMGMPLLLIFTGFLPLTIPGYFSVFSGLLVIGILLVFFLRREWFKWAVIGSAYLFIPGLVYLAHTEMPPWMVGIPYEIYFMFFLLLLLLGWLTLRLTERTKGFRPTPMDFLILFFALVFMVLPDLRIAYGLIAVKIILLYFCLEIIMGEVREEVGKVSALIIVAYLVAAVRGLMG